MKIAISSDEYHPILEALFKSLEQRNIEYLYFGPKQNEKPQNWTKVTLLATDSIKDGRADEGIVLCWTGTGCAMIANKVNGIRAALCTDGETAKGAKIWNHANVLALSLRLLSEGSLKEILTSWFETPYSSDDWNIEQISVVNALESGF
ncbi:MAG: Ribose-5-P isomerase B [Chlamydiia bacterium]|nr:Ribose-5-P isomerase B [Chlamydiia bacterium]